MYIVCGVHRCGSYSCTSVDIVKVFICLVPVGTCIMHAIVPYGQELCMFRYGLVDVMCACVHARVHVHIA